MSYKKARLRVFTAWYDLWVGVYVSVESKTVYVCPLPCVVIAYRWGHA